MRGSTLLAALLLLVAACQPGTRPPDATASPSPSASGTATAEASTPASPSPSPSRTPRPSPSQPAGPLAHPGRPYDATAILAVMRASRRPGGVPDQVETRAVARVVAAQTWTWDGTAWDDMAIGGSCGTAACTLEVSGSFADGAGADLYTFNVRTDDGSVTLEAADLHAHPASLEPMLDRTARGALHAGRLQGLALASSRWLPPPDTDRYWLAYRSGGEEGSPGLDVLLDLASGEVLQVIEVSG